MATTSGPTRTTADESGGGWVLFAGIMLSMLGIVNVIYGIAAISDSKFFVANTTYIFSSLHAYGWLLTLIGALQVVAAFAIFGRAGWARWVGIITAGLNGLVQLVYVAAYPLASIALLAIDILVIYGLVAYGKRSRAEF